MGIAPIAIAGAICAAADDDARAAFDARRCGRGRGQSPRMATRLRLITLPPGGRR